MVRGVVYCDDGLWRDTLEQLVFEMVAVHFIVVVACVLLRTENEGTVLCLPILTASMQYCGSLPFT